MTTRIRLLLWQHSTKTASIFFLWDMHQQAKLLKPYGKKYAQWNILLHFWSFLNSLAWYWILGKFHCESAWKNLIANSWWDDLIRGSERGLDKAALVLKNHVKIKASDKSWMVNSLAESQEAILHTLCKNGRCLTQPCLSCEKCEDIWT